MTLGNVYFIREGNSGPIKIGWTARDLMHRRDTLQIGNSKTLMLLGHIPNVPKSVEGEWHLRFRDLHVRAEWFLASRVLLNAINEAAIPNSLPPRRSRSAPGTKGGWYANSPGRAVLAGWMEKHGLDQAAVAELTGYKLSYLADLLDGRAPFGRETAKRLYALGGDELHPAMLLADRAHWRHIKPYLARVNGEAA